MDTSQMIESFQAMLLQFEEWRRQEAGEERQKGLMEERVKEKRKCENEIPQRRQKQEFSHQADDIKAFIQDDTTAKFVLLRGDLMKQVGKVWSFYCKCNKTN